MEFLSKFGNLIYENTFISIIIVFFAGILSSFSPCSLSSITLIIGYVGGYKENNKKRSFIYSLSFALGLAITLTVLGIIAATIGKMFLHIGHWWYAILGIIMIFVSLQMLGIIKTKKNSCKVHKTENKRKGILGAFLLGILGGVFASHCSTPILIAILTLAAEKGNVLLGAILLFIYSIGHSILIIIAGTSVGFAQNFINSNKTNMIGKIFKYIFASIIILIGLYMFYLSFL